MQILAARGGLGNECACSSMAVADSNSCLYTLPSPHTVDKQNVYSSGTTILKSAKYGSTLVQASDRAVTSKFVRVVSASIICEGCICKYHLSQLQTADKFSTPLSRTQFFSNLYPVSDSETYLIKSIDDSRISTHAIHFDPSIRYADACTNLCLFNCVHACTQLYTKTPCVM